MPKYMLFLLLFLTAFSTTAGLKEQIASIDECVKKGPSYQIKELYNHANEILKDNEHYKFAREYYQPKGHLNQEDAFSSMSPHALLIFLGGVAIMEGFLNKEDPDGNDVYLFAGYLSVLFDPVLRSSEEDYEKKSGGKIDKKSGGPYAGPMRRAHELIGLGCQGAFTKSMPKLPEYTPTLTLMPVVMMGDDAIYENESFVYALAQGIWLSGLPHDKKNETDAYDYSAFYHHDTTHYNIVFDGLSYEEVNKAMEYIRPFAKKLYDFIGASKDDKERHFRSWMAGYLVRENAGLIAKLNNLSDIEYFDIAAKGLESTLCQSNELGLFYDKELNLDEHSYLRAVRVLSEFAFSLVDIHPELEKEIFGDDKNIDRTIHYNGKKTLIHMLKDLDIFSKDFIKFLSE